MTVTVCHDTIACPACGQHRHVTGRQRRRAASQGGIACATCRGHSPLAVKTDSLDRHLRYWLRTYGTPVPAGQTPAQFIAAGGAPHDLVRLATDIFPPR